MSRIRSRNTKPELTLRRYLHKSGFRYRVKYPLLGKPDIVFPKKKIAIFVHGCFWHQHGCKNSVIPKTNSVFWKVKLHKNILRDKKVSRELKSNQWIYKIIWECDIEKSPANVTKRLIKFLYERGLKSYEIMIKEHN